MKKLLLLAAAALAVVSCSDDDGLNTNNNTALKRTETFAGPVDGTPWGIINTKQVKQYQNGLVVSDTTYNAANNEVFRYTVRTTAGNQYTETCYNADNTVFYEYIKQYDDSGHIIETRYSQGVDIQHKYISYGTGTAIVTAFDPYLNQTYTEATFEYNTAGYISNMALGSMNLQLSYANGKPSQSVLTSMAGGNTTTFNYYNSTIPNQYVATPLQINNAILSTTNIFSASYEIYDFKGFDNNDVYDTEFNSQGYITHRVEVLDGADAETFYYYN